MKSPHIVTLGCRLNTAESEVMKAFAIQNGLHNAVIVNTCAVTAEAERQARQTVRRLRKENPDAFIIVTGCAAQLRPHQFADMPEVDRVLGNDVKSLSHSFSRDFPHRVQVGPIPKEIPAEDVPALHTEGRCKAFVQIQNGCNHFCTFCTIPMARGRSRSVPPEVIIRQVQNLLDQGVQEIVLTGVDLTSYGEKTELSLGGMIRKLLDEVPHLNRLRLSSLDSMEVTEDLRELIVYEPRILPHIHLSLQAGSSWILKAMKRRHTRQQAIDLCQDLKNHRPELALGADFIVGFPGETDDMFQETMDSVVECGLSHLHVFPFSKRPGTLAALMENQVPSAVTTERAKILRTHGAQQLEKWLTQHRGKTVSVLAEQPLKGHSDDFSEVRFSQPVTPNSLVRGVVTETKEDHLVVHPDLCLQTPPQFI